MNKNYNRLCIIIAKIYTNNVDSPSESSLSKNSPPLSRQTHYKFSIYFTLHKPQDVEIFAYVIRAVT